ncbi:hypothetical protein BJ875DRAFT_377432 [Amylocarpus encephaloides]|uniref:Zinc finger PHD-type domain-containing protein n=1 Tax=Amylocarpus encephaloides TaxID=45428 RepID=A0A9P8C6G1_9HELO|nr:hypothetical protein BJ875DRAFT_377432 [Amylocarpus encephaloides]
MRLYLSKLIPDPSFGNPNAQPPTPTKTPTSAQFPSPTFQTPRNNSPSFEDRGGWTPQFAEEYSVFNSTPGRLTTNSFVDISTPRLPNTATQQRPLSSAGDIAAELATHVHHLSPNPNIQLLPVDPLDQLPSSPGPYSISHNRFDDSSKNRATPRKPKKRLEEAFSGQTATPPATASKGSRKLAPRLQTGTMQSEFQDGQYGSSQTPTHSNFISFSSASADFFGYPMSAPATAPIPDNSKSFWEPDTDMGGMAMDFTADDAGMFSTGGHKITNSFDWGKSNQMFQETVNVPPSSQSEPKTTPKRQRPLAPKVSVSQNEPQTSMAPFNFTNTTMSEDPFSAGVSAVDPGVLFSRNPTTMPSDFEDVSLPPTRPVTSHNIPLEPYQHQTREASRDREELLRSRGVRDSGGKASRFDRGIVSSPVKGSARPGLHRSLSDSRGKRTQGIPRTGRISPVKQQRPPSLSSIPEMPPPGSRTEVRFTIDSRGRARTETVVVQEEPRLSRDGGNNGSEHWDSSSPESSSDDEPIIIPSRNNSFALQQQKGPKLTRFDTPRGSTNSRRRSTGGYSQSESSSQQSLQFDDVESEAETVMDEDDGSGDATLEMRKLLESRNRAQMVKCRTPRHHRYSTNNPRGSSHHISYDSSNLSPTTVTDPGGATPSSARSSATRCVCNKGDGEGFMIQWQSCDCWLHGECVNIDPSSLPPVYICAFCANTPNKRGGRLREPARPGVGSSPLAHKSFKSFR